MTTTAQDVVGIFDSNGNQKFIRARGMRLSTDRVARMPQHPLETGGSVVDARVIMPVEATLLVVLQSGDYSNVYSQIQSSFNNGELLSVHCKAGVFTNMCIMSIPHEETPEMVDAIQIAVRLIEVRFYKSQAVGISRPATNRSANTTARGQQTTRPASVLHNILH